jgi:hypothetical protein
MSTGGYTPIGSSSDVKMVNQGAYDNALQQIQQNIGNYGSGFSGAQSQLGSTLGQLSALSGNYDNLIKQLTGGNGQQGLSAKIGALGDQYDPNAGFNLFLSQQPQLQGIAEQLAKNSLSEYGQSAQELARETSRASLSDTASQLGSAGLLGAGAGTAAMTQAALAPQLQAATQMAQMRSNLIGNVGGQLLSQGFGQAQGAYDTQQQALLNSLLGQGQMIGQAGDLLGNQMSGLGAAAQGYSGMAGNLASLLGNAQSSYAQMNQPEYWQPQYEKQAGLMDWVSALAPLVGSIFGSGGAAGGEVISRLLDGEGGGAGTRTPYIRPAKTYGQNYVQNTEWANQDGFSTNDYNRFLGLGY